MIDRILATTEGTPELSAVARQRRVAVAIPSYNEERFIGSVVLKARKYADIILVVDDGSSDLTADVAADAGAEVIRHPKNLGKAAALNSAFTWASGNGIAALVVIDGDGQHQPNEIPAIVQPVLDGRADMVVGTRFGTIESPIPSYRQFGQHALTKLTNFSSGLTLTDSQSGFRAFSRAALERIRFHSHRFAVESEMQFLAKQAQLRVLEVSISAVYEEPAKRNPAAHGFQVLRSLIDMLERERPLLSFGTAGLVALFAGLALGVHVLTVDADTQTLAIGLAMLTLLLVIVGLFTAFVGIILHALKTSLEELRDG